MVEHITTLDGSVGNPRKTTMLPTPLIREYHKRYRLTRWLRNRDAALRDPNTIIIENYGLLPHLFQYSITALKGYYKWLNIQTTLWTTVGRLAVESDRQQYLVVNLPKVIPSRQLLSRAANGITRDVLDKIGSPDTLFMLELWKWLGEQRAQSILTKAGDKLVNMNLVFIDSGQWFMVNLGKLNSWRDESASSGKLAPKEIQNRFLRLMYMMADERTSNDTSIKATTTVSEVSSKQLDPNKVDDQDSVVEVHEIKLKPIEITASDPEKGRHIKLKLRVNQDILHLPDEPIEETRENIDYINSTIERELDEIDKLHHSLSTVNGISTDGELHSDRTLSEREPFEQPIIRYSKDKRNAQATFMAKVDGLADMGMVSAAEYRRFSAISGAYQKIPDPYGSDTTLALAMEIDPRKLEITEGTKLPDVEGVLDKSMLKSSLQVFDRKYIEEFLSKDVLRSVVGLQNAGIAVTGYSVEFIEDAMNSYEAHSVQLTPAQGKSTTIHFRIPKIRSDGTLYSNGVRYRIRKQRSDVPIRKVNSSTVALTSYYSKTFVSRSERQTFNYPGWLTDQIAAQGIDPSNSNVTQLMFADVFDNNWKAPRLYSTLAMRFRSFTVNDIDFFLDYTQRYDQFGEQEVRNAERGTMTVIGKKKNGLVVIDPNDQLYLVSKDAFEPLGQFESLIELKGKPPIEVAELKVFGKAIPIGIALGYLMGFGNLLALMEITPRRIQTGDRFSLNEDEFIVRFEDESLIFSKENRLASLVFGGFQTIEAITKNYSVHRFDKKDIYLLALQQNRIGLRYLKELDLLNDLFVDPITEEILTEMGEPVQFPELLLRACEMLVTDYAPDETDMSVMRIKGYERVAGTIYSELVKAIRLYRARGSSVNAKIEMPPYAVWQAIQQDPAVKLVEESNPIHQLKETEEVTYSGAGGRSSRSMTKTTRVFHENDMGVISEATKDSADVAITTFLTADPKLKNLRGLTHRFNVEKDGATPALSTSALVSPAADRDDPKRVNFISIQHSSGTFAKGYQPQPVRTGYERVIAQRTDGMFAITAKQKGRVVESNDTSIKVEYADGTKQAYPIGRRYGIAAGVTYPHSLIANLKQGSEFVEGDCLLFNEHYFAKDPLNPTQVIWKAGVLVKTALLESPDTLEDSSVISEEVARLMETDLTKVREITIGFDQVVHNLINVGDTVDIDSILCTIEDAVTAQSKLFDETSIDTLRLIAANNPKAKFKGVVEKIEFFYNGEFDDLSESLKILAHQSDLQRKRTARDLGQPFTSGRVDGSLRIEGTALPFENAVVRIYITGPVTAGIGDKGVFGNQMKTIFGRVMSGVNETASGEALGALFAMQSVDARMIQSPIVIGTTNTLLKVISKRVVDVYRR
jgi:hypothetical protein